MASLDEFELNLKEVVNAKRLSASKMTRLTEITLKSVEYDTQLVSILYRTHKSLPPAAKVSSLYVFDALSRAARYQVNKQSITGDMNTSKGNAATFLLKIEGVLEGLFQDMITIGSPEAKEKTQKILDIWVKGTTFPHKILSRLMNVVKGPEKVPETKPLTTSDPRMAVAPQPIVSTPTPPAAAASVAPAMDPQATLLALLAQAANVAAMPAQTTANTGVAPVFDAQLAVLQQLALAQTTSSAAPSQPAPPQAPSAQSGSAFPTPSSYREEPFDTHHKDRRFNGPQSSDRVNAYDDQLDDRASFRGGFRGGFRGRGRGRWDDRDRDRYRERDSRDDRNPAYRGRRSRSRSPPRRQGGRHDVRPYSPPRRPNFSPTAARGRNSADPGPTPSDTAGKDEFGRDIRPPSPESDSTLTTIISPPKHDASASASPPPSAPPEPTAASGDQNPPPGPSAAALTSNHDRMSLSPLITANTSSMPSAPVDSSIVSAQEPGLDTFNIATFDFTSPVSWEALGKMWLVTHGYMPTTEELGHFVMMGGQTAFASAPAPVPVQNGHRWQAQGQAWRGRGRGGFARGRGRGGFGSGHAQGVQESDWGMQDSNHDTDAIVLGGGSDTGMEIEQTDTSQTRGGGGGGRMQRVGDKWVFVRDSVAA